jgi:hypothetical protein
MQSFEETNVNQRGPILDPGHPSIQPVGAEEPESEALTNATVLSRDKQLWSTILYVWYFLIRHLYRPRN